MNASHAEKWTWTGHEAVLESTRQALLDYLRDLHVKDAVLLNSLAADCLSHARRRVAPGFSGELLRRAIEEAQRRVDSALARLLGLSATRDLHALAGARAALLLCAKDASTDFLFDQGTPDTDRLSRLKALLPKATPAESPRAMVPQKFDFFLFKSS